MRRAISWILLVLGGILLGLSVLAGYVNRTVLDAGNFAESVDELRQVPAVSQALGHQVASEIVAQDPDLIAIAPLVESIATGVMGSDLLSGPVRVGAAQALQAVTTPGSEQVVLRIADVGAFVTGTLAVIRPGLVPNARGTSAVLAEIGSQGFAAGLIRVAGVVDTLAWLLPLLGIGCLVGAVLVGRDRWDAVRRAGWAAVAAAAVVGLAVLGGGIWARGAGGAGEASGVVDAVWEVFVRPLWWPIALLGLTGGLVVMVGSGRAASWEASDLTGWLTTQSAGPRAVVLRAVVLIGVGVLAVLEPTGTLTGLAVVGGVVLIVAGVGALARLAAPAPEVGAAEHRSRGLLLAVAGVSVAALIAATAWAARAPQPASAVEAAGVVAGTGEVCNGFPELCERRFDEVSYAATHNAMSVAGKPGWYLAEQGRDILPQLDAGVRALLVDVWYGRDAGNGKVRTAAQSYKAAKAVATLVLGKDTVAAALRAVDAVAPGEPSGEKALYMCHGLCETGATSFDETLSQVRGWLATHPDEVLTLFIEDHVGAEDIGAAVEGAGLAPYAFTPVAGQPFPTLGEMIRSGQRLVVMIEMGSTPPAYPWLANGFDFIQETPYTFPDVASFSCEPNRGPADAPLLQINHWLANFDQLVTSAQQVNTAAVLGARAQQCRQERGMQPTFVAVNFADIGDLIPVVNELNGVG